MKGVSDGDAEPWLESTYLFLCGQTFEELSPHDSRYHYFVFFNYLICQLWLMPHSPCHSSRNLLQPKHHSFSSLCRSQCHLVKSHPIMVDGTMPPSYHTECWLQTILSEVILAGGCPKGRFAKLTWEKENSFFLVKGNLLMRILLFQPRACYTDDTIGIN